MASDNGSEYSWRADPFAWALGALGLATIIAEAALAFAGHPVPTALDYVLCTIAGAVGGGFRARNGNGGNGTGTFRDERRMAGDRPDSPGVRVG